MMMIMIPLQKNSDHYYNYYYNYKENNDHISMFQILRTGSSFKLHQFRCKMLLFFKFIKKTCSYISYIYRERESVRSTYEVYCLYLCARAGEMTLWYNGSIPCGGWVKALRLWTNCFVTFGIQSLVYCCTRVQRNTLALTLDTRMKDGLLTGLTLLCLAAEGTLPLFLLRTRHVCIRTTALHDEYIPIYRSVLPIYISIDRSIDLSAHFFTRDMLCLCAYASCRP